MTKTALFFASMFISWLSNNYVPLDWQFMGLKVVSLLIGVCMGYNIWRLWKSQDEIKVGIITIYQYDIEPLFNKIKNYLR